jgi:hypothetical protein
MGIVVVFVHGAFPMGNNHIGGKIPDDLGNFQSYFFVVRKFAVFVLEHDGFSVNHLGESFGFFNFLLAVFVLGQVRGIASFARG